MKTILHNKLKRDNVQDIKLLFNDIMGIEKSLTIAVNKLDDLLNKNVWVDASDVEGLLSICDDEMYLLPKSDSYSIVKNIDGSINAIIKCDIYRHDGTLYNYKNNGSSQNVIKEARDKGYNCMSEDELVSFLFTNISLKSFESKIYY